MIKILRQPLVRQQFPLKLACALDARYRRRRSQNEVASESDPSWGERIETELEHNMKLQHPGGPRAHLTTMVGLQLGLTFQVATHTLRPNSRS
eukprot:s1491_g4.t1